LIYLSFFLKKNTMCYISIEIFQKHTRRNSNLPKKSLPPSRPKSTLKQHISIYIDKKLAIYIYILKKAGSPITMGCVKSASCLADSFP
jgi:hypothetical protein